MASRSAWRSRAYSFGTVPEWKPGCNSCRTVSPCGPTPTGRSNRSRLARYSRQFSLVSQNRKPNRSGNSHTVGTAIIQARIGPSTGSSGCTSPSVNGLTRGTMNFAARYDTGALSGLKPGSISTTR